MPVLKCICLSLNRPAKIKTFKNVKQSARREDIIKQSR